MAVHIETCNESFVLMYERLEKIAPRNCTFMLDLQNPNLIDVDPHDIGLTQHQKLDVLRECMDNPWYFLREVCRIQDQGSRSGTFLPLNTATLTSAYLYLQNANEISIYMRQSLKTVVHLCLLMWEFLFREKISMKIECASVNDAMALMRRIREMLSFLPPYILKYQDFQKRMVEKITKMENVVNRNNITIGPGLTNASSERVKNLAREMYVDRLYCDDIFLVPNIDVYINEIMPLMCASMRLAVSGTSIWDNAYLAKLFNRACPNGSVIFWDDAMYNEPLVETGDLSSTIFMVHYEPDQIVSKKDIERHVRSLYQLQNKPFIHTAKTIRNELSILPFSHLTDNEICDMVLTYIPDGMDINR